MVARTRTQYTMTPLYAHQKELVDRFPHKAILAHATGTGKTRTSLELAKKSGAKALVVSPKALVPKWERDIVTWGADADAISKENFKKNLKQLPHYDAIIIDECHLGGFANHKSQMHKATAAYMKAHEVQYRWLLSATPYCSTPWNIYSLLKLIDVNLDYWQFRNRFFIERYFGQRCVFVPRDGIEDEVADLVREHGSVVRLDDCADIPDQQTVEKFFGLTKDQKNETARIKSGEQNPIVRFTKMHQIASGIHIGNEFSPTRTFSAEKNDYIVSLAESNEKILVFSRYNAHLDMLASMLEKKHIPYRMIRGDVKDRDAVVQEAEKAKRMVVLANAACSTGYELPSFPVCVFASLSYSYSDHVQGMGRVLRINKLKKNIFFILTTRDSADVPVLESIRRKETFSEAIFMRNNPEQ